MKREKTPLAFGMEGGKKKKTPQRQPGKLLSRRP